MVDSTSHTDLCPLVSSRAVSALQTGMNTCTRNVRNVHTAMRRAAHRLEQGNAVEERFDESEGNPRASELNWSELWHHQGRRMSVGVRR